MNRGILESSHLQQMIGRNPSLWSMNDLISLPIQETSSILPPFSSSSSIYLQSSQPLNFLPTNQWQDSQELPLSWSQLLLGGYVEEEERWEDHVTYQSETTHGMVDVKQENEEIPTARSPWSQDLSTNSSTKSCATTSSSSKAERKHIQSSECDSTNGSAFKKARVQSCSAQSHLKVRKEKLGDRVASLHQLVSPFGKTDTASVLSEAIGYIRFLQSQIEALSLPYLGNVSTHHTMPSEGDGEVSKDLKSRGLCLVPVSTTMNVGSDNGADYWTQNNFGDGFQ